MRATIPFACCLFMITWHGTSVMAVAIGAEMPIPTRVNASQREGAPQPYCGLAAIRLWGFR